MYAEGKSELRLVRERGGRYDGMRLGWKGERTHVQYTRGKRWLRNGDGTKEEKQGAGEG